ncbi:MAG TPA: ParB/RepB/Spo0J family partition protein [Pseudolabrys sp.]|jgi:ParB family transcriptional regulator, chromosome partitioning protein
MSDHSRLGRGLAALIGDVGDETSAADSSRKPRRAPIENLRPNPRNPRRSFTDSELDELSVSIRERGIIQPIVVRALEGDNFEIIAGERRWRAAQRAGLHDVPIAVVEANDAQSLEFAIIENVQRTDLNPIEEASGYLALMDDFNRTQEDVAQIVGKSRPHVANTIRLLKLSEPVKQLVRSGKISAGHARLLVGHPNAEQIAQEIIEKNLSVRQVEAQLQQEAATQRRESQRESKGNANATKDADTRALEKRLSDALGLAVSVDHRGEGGTLRIKYRDLEQLDAVLKKLGA